MKFIDSFLTSWGLLIGIFCLLLVIGMTSETTEAKANRCVVSCVAVKAYATKAACEWACEFRR